MTKPIYQHFLPKTYLREFRIDDNENKSFVYCVDYATPYKKGIYKKGINDKIFKRKKYYADSRLEDPYSLEIYFATEVEPLYGPIMATLKKEGVIPEFIRESIIIWTFMSQMRNPRIRDRTGNVMQWIIEMKAQYEKSNLNTEQKQFVRDYVKRSSKEIQLDIFLEEEYLQQHLSTHIDTLNAKHWKIIKAASNYPFMTNDNPGFSPNMHHKFSHQTPFHDVMELNAHSIIYYVFSPTYCLEIRPFFEGTPLEICALNMDIKFEQGSKEYIDHINEGVFFTKRLFVVANSQTLLNNFIRKSKTSIN